MLELVDKGVKTNRPRYLARVANEEKTRGFYEFELLPEYEAMIDTFNSARLGSAAAAELARGRTLLCSKAA